MEFQPGMVYTRPCAIVKMDDGREYAIPIFDFLHADPQFGFPHEHYHIDGRFYLEPRMRQEYCLDNGHTNAVIKTKGGSPTFLRIEQRSLKCIHDQAGLKFPATPTERQRRNLAKYERWYSGFVGKTCEGKRCPHYGTEMLEKNGLLVCPLHELKADPHTLLILPRN